jgi:Ca2+-binding EF-hand superfamily protein
MKLVFNLFDLNGNGVIDTNELERVLHGLNQNPTPEEMEEVRALMDPEGEEREREREREGDTSTPSITL